MARAPRATVAITVAAVLVVAAVVLRLLVGGGAIQWPTEPVIWALRADRALTAVAVGSALAISGVGLQCLLRNPLASPDLLGLASGAGLGAMLVVWLHFRATGGFDASPAAQGVAALTGSIAALLLVFALSQRRGLIDPTSLILIGVILGLMASAGIMVVQHLVPDRGVRTSRWLLGAITDDAPRWRAIAVLGLTAVVAAAGVRWGRWLDAASLADDEAVSVGVPLRLVRSVLLVVSGALAAASVWIAGPIGFVGLVAPHLARLAGGPRHRVAVVVAALLGAALVAAADALVAAIPTSGGRLPLGVVTTVVGGPIFVFMLLRGRHR